jgi:hypothetical protein
VTHSVNRPLLHLFLHASDERQVKNISSVVCIYIKCNFSGPRLIPGVVSLFISAAASLAEPAC